MFSTVLKLYVKQGLYCKAAPSSSLQSAVFLLPERGRGFCVDGFAPVHEANNVVDSAFNDLDILVVISNTVAGRVARGGNSSTVYDRGPVEFDRTSVVYSRG